LIYVLISDDFVVILVDQFNRLLGEEFSHVYISTIGIDEKKKEYNIDGRKIILRIWDTSGQERFYSVAKNYYRKVDGLLLVYDITGQGMLVI
jgi:small GTP-binding protein